MNIFINTLFQYFEGLESAQTMKLFLFGAAILLFDSELLISAVPFFTLSCASCANSEGCASCANSEGCAGCGCGSEAQNSTPFLAVWKDGQFKIDNDVLFGKPHNAFKDAVMGKILYEQGNITPDLYKICTPFDVVDGVAKFQVREIEPEESFIDHIALRQISYANTAELLVESNLKMFKVLDRNELEASHGCVDVQVTNGSGESLPELLSTHITQKIAHGPYSRAKIHMMEAGESIEIRGKVIAPQKEVCLVLGSNFHDWIVSATYGLSTISNFQPAPSQSFFKNALRLCIFALVLLPTWITSVLFSKAVATPESEAADNGLLLAAFGAYRAHADVPSRVGSDRSLHIEYWNGEEFQLMDIIHPRYYTSSFNIVTLPKQAINGDGEVYLRITATKRHNVVHVSLVAPSTELPYKVVDCPLASAQHTRTKQEHVETLAVQDKQTYLHTVPGDIVNIEFSVPSTSEELLGTHTVAYTLHASGFYTDLSEEGKRMAGTDWVSRLSPDSKVWLQEMISLKS